ncbi:unnamed protein product, partial [Rotaria magnacalcarata]
MEYTSKKSSWLEYFNEPVGRTFKHEALFYDLTDMQSTPIDNNNYTRMDSDMGLSYDVDSNTHHLSGRVLSLENSKIRSNKQQRTTLAK